MGGILPTGIAEPLSVHLPHGSHANDTDGKVLHAWRHLLRKRGHGDGEECCCVC